MWVGAAVVVAAAVAVCLVLVTGTGSGGHAAAGHAPAGRTSSSGSATAVRPVAPSVSLQVPVPAPTTSAVVPGVPVHVAVPRVGIASSLEPLGLDSRGRLVAPSRFARAGWYAKGVRPGAVGPAVIAGHVDSTGGPAVFFALRRVRVGDRVEVRDSAGVVRRFTVTEIHQYPKSHFPTDAVYGPTAQPIVRLVTCTGAFDEARRSYLDNLVVSAALDVPRAG